MSKQEELRERIATLGASFGHKYQAILERMDETGDFTEANQADNDLADEILKACQEMDMAFVDREAKVPQREKLVKGALLLQAQDKNDIYLNGQIIAQKRMLEEDWHKAEEIEV